MPVQTRSMTKTSEISIQRPPSNIKYKVNIQKKHKSIEKKQETLYKMPRPTPKKQLSLFPILPPSLFPFLLYDADSDYN